MVIAELIDDIIYDAGRKAVISDGQSYFTDDEQSWMDRSFSYLVGDFESFVWPLISKTLYVTHERRKRPYREIYSANVGWRVEQVGTTADLFVTNFSLSFFKDGSVQGEIEEMDVILGTQAVRALTDYDYSRLFDELYIVKEIQAAERQEAGRSPA